MTGAPDLGAAGARHPSHVGAGLPPFVPTADPPVPAGAELVPWHAPLAHPVFLPAAVGAVPDDARDLELPPMPDDRCAAGRADVDTDLPGALFNLPESSRGDALPVAMDEAFDVAMDEAVDEAMASIRDVIKELRQYAGEAATGDGARARWFSLRGPDGTVQRVDGTARADAEAAARHLERLAQRVRAGALPLLEVEEPLREASTLVLTLAALHGARAPR
ncbi:MAG: hypothetical protein RLZ32_1665 [Gemmatimonadota bacterium]